MPADPSPAAAPTKPVLRCLAGLAADGPPPVWLMRQAGRYLPEYRALRARAGGFLAMCYTPELAAEITLQPLRRFPLDAAILFSDILVVPHALGMDVRFLEGEGPRLEPVRTLADVARLDPSRLLAQLEPVLRTLERVRRELPPQATLLGFAGAPWTLAAYALEGGGSRDFETARALARREPALALALIDVLTEATITYLAAQIEHGAEAVQLFDSWAGALAPGPRAAWCVRPAQRIVAALAARHPGVPVLLFPRGVGLGLPEFAGLGAAALGLDTTVPIERAVALLADVPCLQGNLDPTALLGDRATLKAEASRILRATAGRAHIFNLGHGVLPSTDPAAVAELVAHLKDGAGCA